MGDLYTLSQKLGWDNELIRMYYSKFCDYAGSTAKSNMNDALWDDDNGYRSMLLDVINNCGNKSLFLEALYAKDNTNTFLNWLDYPSLMQLWNVAGFMGPPPPANVMITQLRTKTNSQLAGYTLIAVGALNGADFFLANIATETLLKAMTSPSTGTYSFCDFLDDISDCGSTTTNLTDFVFDLGDTALCDEIINDSTNATYLLSLLANAGEKQFYKNAADLNPNWIVAAMQKLTDFDLSDYLNKAYHYLGKPKYEEILEEIGPDLEIRQSLTLSELHVYGSSRIGISQPKRVLLRRAMTMDSTGNMDTIGSDTTFTQYTNDFHYFKRTLSYKQFELSNHLGNVLTTVLDRKTAVVDTNSTGDTVMYYIADVYTAQCYYAFGSSMPGLAYRHQDTAMGLPESEGGGYRFGFNTQEKEPELGNGFTSAEFWMYDGRLGRRWNIDPRPSAPDAPYICFDNNPIIFTDFNGDTSWVYDMCGTLQYTLNDNLDNQIIFGNQFLLEICDILRKGGANDGNDDEAVADRKYYAECLRDPKSHKADFFENNDPESIKNYYKLVWGREGIINNKSINEMKEIADYGTSINKEVAFTVWVDQDRVLRFEMLALDPTATGREMSFEKAAFNTYGDNAARTLASRFGWGHAHIEQALSLWEANQAEKSAAQKNFFLAEPTPMGGGSFVDYAPYLMGEHMLDNRETEYLSRQSIAFIVTPYGFSIYFTMAGAYEQAQGLEIKDRHVPNKKKDYYLFK